MDAGFAEEAELDALFAAASSDAAPDYGASEPDALPAGIPVASSRRKRVGARLFGSRARTLTSTVVAVIVIALVAAGAFVGVRAYTDQRELVEAQALLESAQADATDADGVATDAQATLAASVASGGTTVEEVSPALDAVDGVAPADQLAAARAALAALQGLLAPAVAAPPSPYEKVAEAQDIGAVRAAEQTAREHAATVNLAAVDVRQADTKIKTARGSLFTALVALGAALPATADGLLSENPLAESQFRDAVTAAALQVGVAQKSGGTGAAELIAYSQAVAALRESQTTQAEAQARASRRSSGGSGGTGGGSTSPSPSPSPTPTPTPTPPPDPVPVPVPDPSPSPSP